MANSLETDAVIGLIMLNRVSGDDVEDSESPQSKKDSSTNLVKSKQDRKRHVCECGISYSQAAGLSRHRRIVHTGLTYKCPICNRSFKRSESLNYHLKRRPNSTTDVPTCTPPSSPPPP